MEFSFWFMGIGALLIAMNLGSRLIARAPLSPAMLYFAFGVALGPWGLGWLAIDPFDDAPVVERICEFALLVSLFATGSNLGGTLRGRHWSVPLRLASGAMLVTITALCALAYFVLGLSLGASLVLAAALAPTDPVLAGDVQVADPADRDRLRFGLTGEAGLNDGAAFPFVMLGLGLLSLREIGRGGWRWWAIDLAWAVAGGLAIGAILGIVLGRWLIHRNREKAREAGSDAFLGLGLVAVAYGVAGALQACGFLAVFAAAVALQRTVSGVSSSAPTPAPASEAVAAPLQQFNAHLESLAEFAVVIMVGALFAAVRVPAMAFVVIAVLFLVIRPLSVLLALAATRTDRAQRLLASWFGIRGVGTMYYAMYAINAGIPHPAAAELLGITIAVVVASIFLHGISVTPLMTVYQHGRRRVARGR